MDDGSDAIKFGQDTVLRSVTVEEISESVSKFIDSKRLDKEPKVKAIIKGREKFRVQVKNAKTGLTS